MQQTKTKFPPCTPNPAFFFPFHFSSAVIELQVHFIQLHMCMSFCVFFCCNYTTNTRRKNIYTFIYIKKCIMQSFIAIEKKKSIKI